MTCTRIPGGFVCSFSDGRNYHIEVRGKTYFFDWSDRFGPLRMNSDGTDSKRELPLYVIDAMQRWFEQGKQRGPNGLCVWRVRAKERKRERNETANRPGKA